MVWTALPNNTTQMPKAQLWFTDIFLFFKPVPPPGQATLAHGADGEGLELLLGDLLVVLAHPPDGLAQLAQKSWYRSFAINSGKSFLFNLKLYSPIRYSRNVLTVEKREQKQYFYWVSNLQGRSELVLKYRLYFGDANNSRWIFCCELSDFFQLV